MPEKYKTVIKEEQEIISENNSQSDSYPVLYVFKYFNAFSTFLLYGISGWSNQNPSIILNIIVPVSIISGIASIFTPARKANIKVFKIFSYFLYLGLLLSFII